MARGVEGRRRVGLRRQARDALTGSVYLVFQPLHFFFQPQLLALELPKDVAVWTRTLILIGDPQFQAGVPFLQRLDPRLQAHGASYPNQPARDAHGRKTVAREPIPLFPSGATDSCIKPLCATDMRAAQHAMQASC